MNVTQHIPNFVTGVSPQTAHAGTMAELEAIPWITSWKADKDFLRFSLSAPKYLMVELTDRFYVIAYLDEPERYGLPRWSPSK